MNDINKKFGKWLNHNRLKRKIPIKVLSDLANITSRHIYILEKADRNNAGLATVEKIAKAFGLTLSEAIKQIEEVN